MLPGRSTSTCWWAGWFRLRGCRWGWLAYCRACVGLFSVSIGLLGPSWSAAWGVCESCGPPCIAVLVVRHPPIPSPSSPTAPGPHPRPPLPPRRSRAAPTPPCALRTMTRTSTPAGSCLWRCAAAHSMVQCAVVGYGCGWLLLHRVQEAQRGATKRRGRAAALCTLQGRTLG